MPKRYRSKPSEVVAALVKDDNWHLVAEWCGGQGFRDVGYSLPDGSTALRSGVRVPTINGWATAFVGHYVVQGPNDFYPCDPDTFAARWELIGDAD